jgi:hypothetical protein
MCMVAYIASDVPLRTWPFDKEKPGFHVTEVAAHNQIVKRHFSKPFVHYAGSFEGCGCGFQYGDYVGGNPERLAAADRCRSDIEAYVREALERQPFVEIYACWSGGRA